MKEKIIEKIIHLRYGCAILESRGVYGGVLVEEMSDKLSKLYEKYPIEYEEAEKRIKKEI